VNLLMLTAGTGSFYCGTCLRDNTLAQGLRALGHDVRLIPLYLPLIIDGESASAGETVLLGGVTAYLQQQSALFRALPNWVDRALDSRAMLSLVAGRAGATNPSALGPMTRSMLAGEGGHQARAIQRLQESLRIITPRPDAVILSNALLLGLAQPIERALECPVLCTLQGEDAFLDALPAGEREAAWDLASERAQDVRAFIAVSAYHRDVMQTRLQIDPSLLHVVHNGIDLQAFEPAEHPPERPTIGYLARLCEDKGVMVLVDAYIALRAQWEGPAPALLLGGALTALDKPTLAAACKRLAEAGVSDHLEVHPNMTLEDKQAFLKRLTVLCVPVQVSESFGLYNLEAMASGVPVIAPTRGALPEVLSATGGGVLVADDSPEPLGKALADLLRDAPRREALSTAGRHAVTARFGQGTMASEVARIISEVVTCPPLY
jgi:glycosyltransferase involved in cell wall biosynthesis